MIEERRLSALPKAVIGMVVGVTGAQMRVRLLDERTSDARNGKASRVGGMIKVADGERYVIGRVTSSEIEDITGRHVVTADLLGEIADETFARGVSHHPPPGADAYAATADDLHVVYNHPSIRDLQIGALYDNPEQPAYVQIDDLLGKHFAVLGSTGSGKSCTVSLIVDAILEQHPNAHVLMLDPHNEYASAFGDKAEVLNVDNLRLPLWMLDSEEAVRVLVVGGTSAERETQAMILRDTIVRSEERRVGKEC